MTDAPFAIEAVELGRDYEATRALDALTLRVRQGAVVGLLGPNGAGKTTAMLLLSTLLTPSRGVARIFGDDVTRDRRKIRRRLGLVFQETSLDGLLTVAENLRFAAGLAGLAGGTAHRAVGEALARTGLEARASQRVRQLSGGWRRLTDIARATLHRPDLLILDEPTVGLDPEHRDRVWALLEAERRTRKTTILFSTHYLAEAESSDRVVLLSRGRTIAEERPAALMDDLGEHVMELEGADPGPLVRALSGLARVHVTIRLERGYRIGVSGSPDDLAKLASTMPGLSRFVLRRPTLDDVYFAKTQLAEGQPMPAATGRA
jgi:ABC-2 type transport system ATP-binding protein